MTDKVNLKEVGKHSKNFQEYQLRKELLNRLYNPQRQRQPADKFTKKTHPNLKKVASNCSTFNEFHEKVSDEE